MLDQVSEFSRVDALFAEALEQPEASRDAFVRAATRDDPPLCTEVLRLLAEVDAAERRIGESAAALLPISDELDELPPDEEPGVPIGTRLGPWRVRGELGRGGMGIVVLAERADGAFERTVAIKLIRDEVSGPGWARRFAAEQRILATLDHRFIARLHDAGTTEDGRPYLVMDHVTGVRIDRYADAQTLDIAARLTLLLDVCDAVSHAHQRLVVHRDLKPANVLVAQGAVRLLDFGIASLLAGQDGAEPTTRRGQRLLTPEYASPEQVRGEPTNVSADVYSLGVILHELLVGERPDWQRLVLAQAGLERLEAALTAPSKSFARLARTDRPRASTIATARRTTPDRLESSVRGDLDAIVLTALAPDPTLRYQTVQALRDDLVRVLNAQPIAVRPISRRERLAKFLRRRRVPVLAAGSLALVTVAYVGTLIAQSRRIARERDRATREQVRATQVASLLTSLFTAADPFETGRPDTLRAGVFLERAASRVESELHGQPAVQAELFATLGSVYRQLDRLGAADTLLQRSHELAHSTSDAAPLQRATAAYELALLRLDQSRFASADTLALQLRESLRAVPGDSSLLLQLRADVLRGRVHLELGRLDSALLAFDTALVRRRRVQPLDSLEIARVLNHRAAVWQRQANYAAALQDVRDAWTMQSAVLGSDHPTTLVNLANVAFLTDRSGNPADAVPLYREMLEHTTARLGASHPSVLMGLVNLGGALGRSGQAEEALRVTERAVAAHRMRPGGPYLEHAVALDYLSGIHDRLGHRTEAIEAATEAVRLMAAINGADHPNTAMIRSMSATLRCRGNEATATDRRAALSDFEQALRGLSVALPPSHPRVLNRRAAYGSCLAADRQFDAAERELTAAFAIMSADAALARDRAAKFVGEEMVRFYETTNQPGKRAQVQSVLDSLARTSEPLRDSTPVD